MMAEVEPSMPAHRQRAVVDLLAAHDRVVEAREVPVSRFKSPEPTPLLAAIRRRNRMIRQAKQAGLDNRTIADICGIALEHRVDLIVEATA